MKSQLLLYFCVGHPVGGSCTPARTKRFSYPRVFADRLSPRWAQIRDRESHFQAPLHKPLLDTNHPAATDIQSLGYLPIGVTGFTLTLIAQQQLTCYQIVLGWSPAGVHHRLQKPSLLLTQSHGRNLATTRLTYIFPISWTKTLFSLGMYLPIGHDCALK
jgi:hypothetical protein